MAAARWRRPYIAFSASRQGALHCRTPCACGFVSHSDHTAGPEVFGLQRSPAVNTTPPTRRAGLSGGGEWSGSMREAWKDGNIAGILNRSVSDGGDSQACDSLVTFVLLHPSRLAAGVSGGIPEAEAGAASRARPCKPPPGRPT